MSCGYAVLQCGAALFDAKDATIIYGWNKNVDVGSGCADNMTNTKECQCRWSLDSGLISCKTGQSVGGVPGSCNFLCRRDGVLMRELLNSTVLSRYGGSNLGGSCSGLLCDKYLEVSSGCRFYFVDNNNVYSGAQFRFRKGYTHDRMQRFNIFSVYDTFSLQGIQ